MSIETSIPYSWLKSISPDIKIQDDVPLWGNPPIFPWEAFSQELSKTLNIPHLEITCKNVQWRPAENLFEGLGESPAFHAFSITPLLGKAYFALPKGDLKKIFQSILDKDDTSEEWQHEWDLEWEDKFYEFLFLQAIQAFHKIAYDPSLSPQILNDTSLPEAPCLCLDIEVSAYAHIFSCRIAISPEMRLSIKEKYISKTLTYPESLAQAVTAILHVNVGSTTLLQKEWETIVPGDLLLLDSCSYSPGDDKGRVILTINNIPIFRAKIKDRSLKLLEYPLLQEVQTPMSKQEDEEFDETFDTEEDSLFEDTEDLDAGFDKTNEENFEDEGIQTKPSSTIPKQSAKDLLNKSGPPPILKPEEIPLTVSIEIARVQLSIQQLMQLAPGNMLDLDITPENGVDLIVNGHCIGKGELLKLGETLGVRILDKA